MLGRTLLALCITSLVACSKEKDRAAITVDTATIGATPRQSSAVTSTCGNEFIGAEGIGRVSIGAPLDSVRVSCKVVRDTTVRADEGTMARKVTVSLSSDTVVAEIVNGRVWRVEVNSSRFRTRDSLGVGTPLERLLTLEDPRGVNGEGRYYVLSPDHCGLSFRLSEGWNPQTVRIPIDRAKLSRLPRSVVVSQVLITGCPND